MAVERVERPVTSVRWIPSEAIEGSAKVPFSLDAAHDDDPLTGRLDVGAWASSDRCRFANELRAWIDVDDGRIVGAGHAGGRHLGSTSVQFFGTEAELEAAALPDLRLDPHVGAHPAC